MPKPVNLAILTFPRCHVLDVTGSAMASDTGNDISGKVHYNAHVLSRTGGTIQTSSAVAPCDQTAAGASHRVRSTPR